MPRREKAPEKKSGSGSGSGRLARSIGSRVSGRNSKGTKEEESTGGWDATKPSEGAIKAISKPAAASESQYETNLVHRFTPALPRAGEAKHCGHCGKFIFILQQRLTCPKTKCQVDVHRVCRDQCDKDITCPPKPGSVREPPQKRSAKRGKVKVPESILECLRATSRHADEGDLETAVQMAGKVLDIEKRKGRDGGRPFEQLLVRYVDLLLCANDPDASMFCSELMLKAPNSAEMFLLRVASAQNEEHALDILEQLLDKFPDHEFATSLVPRLRAKYPHVRERREKAALDEEQRVSQAAGIASSGDVADRESLGKEHAESCRTSLMDLQRIFKKPSPKWSEVREAFVAHGVEQATAASVLFFPANQTPMLTDTVPLQQWEKLTTWLSAFKNRKRAFQWLLLVAGRREFFGFQDPTTAVSALSDTGVGGWLLRMSSQAGALTLSVRDVQEIVEHKRIIVAEQRDGSFGVHVADSSNVPTFAGPTALDDLLDFGKKKTLYGAKNILLGEPALRDAKDFVVPTQDVMEGMYSSTPAHVGSVPNHGPASVRSLVGASQMEDMYGKTPAAPQMEDMYGKTPAAPQMEDMYGKTPAAPQIEDMYGKTPAIEASYSRTPARG